jgi:hypothetical protein
MRGERGLRPHPHGTISFLITKMELFIFLLFARGFAEAYFTEAGSAESCCTETCFYPLPPFALRRFAPQWHRWIDIAHPKWAGKPADLIFESCLHSDSTSDTPFEEFTVANAGLYSLWVSATVSPVEASTALMLSYNSTNPDYIHYRIWIDWNFKLQVGVDTDPTHWLLEAGDRVWVRVDGLAIVHRGALFQVFGYATPAESLRDTGSLRDTD